MRDDSDRGMGMSITVIAIAVLLLCLIGLGGIAAFRWHAMNIANQEAIQYQAAANEDYARMKAEEELGRKESTLRVERVSRQPDGKWKVFLSLEFPATRKIERLSVNAWVTTPKAGECEAILPANFERGSVDLVLTTPVIPDAAEGGPPKSIVVRYEVEWEGNTAGRGTFASAVNGDLNVPFEPQAGTPPQDPPGKK
jgi:hypothetical protein